jgi:hypothetical protein
LRARHRPQRHQGREVQTQDSKGFNASWSS